MNKTWDDRLDSIPRHAVAAEGSCRPLRFLDKRLAVSPAQPVFLLCCSVVADNHGVKIATRQGWQRGRATVGLDGSIAASRRD